MRIKCQLYCWSDSKASMCTQEKIGKALAEHHHA